MLLVGECDDRATERIARLRAVLDAAALGSPQAGRITETLWSKLMTKHVYRQV
jgi:2-dehydropantoate 2-reductase